MNGSIGVFDSGIGGLTVLKEIISLLPHEHTIYLGDTARVPYGTKSADTVTRYALGNTAFLCRQGLKLLVVACNTASAYCLPQLKEHFPIPVVGVIEPGARKAYCVTNKGRIGIIGTEGTIRSGAYKRVLHGFDRNLEVFDQPCPLFVPLVEEGWTDNDIAMLTAERYLQGLKERDIDTLILGCTHYPLLKGVIGRVMGEGVFLVDSAEETALEVKEILKTNDSLKTSGEPAHTFYVTDSPERFIQVGRRFLVNNLNEVERVDLPIIEYGKGKE